MHDYLNGYIMIQIWRGQERERKKERKKKEGGVNQDSQMYVVDGFQYEGTERRCTFEYWGGQLGIYYENEVSGQYEQDVRSASLL